MTLLPLSKALNHCFLTSFESALPARPLVDNTHAYFPLDREEGNPVSDPGVRGYFPLVIVDLGRQPKSVKCSPSLELAVQQSYFR